MVQKIVEQRRVEDRRGIELLPGNGGPNDREDSGTDHRADAESSKRPWPEGLLQAHLGVFRFGDQLVDGLGGEELRQASAPVKDLTSPLSFRCGAAEKSLIGPACW